MSKSNIVLNNVMLINNGRAADFLKWIHFCKPQKEGFCASFLITISASGFIDMLPPDFNFLALFCPISKMISMFWGKNMLNNNSFSMNICNFASK